MGFFYKKRLTSDGNTIYVTKNYVMAKNTFSSCYQVDGNSMFSFSLSMRHIDCQFIKRPAAANCGAKILTYVSDKEHCTMKRPKKANTDFNQVTYDVSDIRQHSVASRRRVFLHCIKGLQCKIVLWRYRSNRSNIWYMRSRGQKCHITNHSVPC